VTLVPGTRLGPYEILAPLGAGGMGEVYRARDARLGRDVAIKALPATFASDAERLARFEREAKVLASLSHPNIAGIHGLEEVAGHRYLVLEFVEGETLAARLERGALPMDEALEVAKQIAAGVEAAHERGIIHRDLKPGNVMLTPSGVVKVLDFGLAKGGDTPGSPSDPNLSASPTMSYAATGAGVILGTAAYMSPEQARGRALDRRTDIWSFGCVLFECLTRQTLFQGETVSDLIAKILEREPDWNALPRGTPPRVRELLKRCLRKDPKERLRDLGDARLELADAIASAPETTVAAPTARRAPAWAWMLGALVGVALGVVVGIRLSASTKPSPTLSRFTIPAPQMHRAFDNFPRVSPDGRRVVFRSGPRLWIRDLQRFESVEIPGTEDALLPFWSHDGTQLGFVKDGKLWISLLSGSNSTPVCAIPASGVCNGASWGKDGKIVFATFRGGLYEVSSMGGEPRLILAPDSTEVDFHLPERLRDDQRVVVGAHRKSGPHPVAVVSLRDGTRKNLREFEGVTNAVYSTTGHLLLNIEVGRQQVLAVPFSDSKLEITGEPFLVAAGGLFPSVSKDGVMTYFLGSSRALRELVWVSHDGRVEKVVGQPQHGLDLPAISPDGQSVALVAYENDNADLWILNLARGTRSRLVSSAQDDFAPLWTGDGRRLVYAEFSNVMSMLKEISVAGTDAPRTLVEGDWPTGTPDGGTLVFSRDITGQVTLWRVDAGEAMEPVRLTSGTTTNERSPALSPDGRWLAYHSDESGADQAFIRSFPDGTGKQQVSLNGGEWAFWSPGGEALYYWEEGALMEVSVRVGPTLELGEARRLFTAADVGISLGSGFAPRPPIAAASDGRFLAVRRASSDAHDGVLVVENWYEEFRKR